jgi:ATP-dependent DNA helicase UvrD/PcrA
MNVKDKLFHMAKQFDIAKKLNSNADTRAAFDYVSGVAESFGHDTAGFLETAVLQGDPDVLGVAAQKVALLTIHAAKGLEFPVVFIAGCENGYIPFIRKSSDTIDIDEERRLFYVAMTRAKDQLFFTRAKTRIIFGKMENRQQSPFVADIKEWLLEKATLQPKKKKKSQIQLTLFS